MKSKKITAAVLGLVLTLGLVVTGCGSNSSKVRRQIQEARKKQVQMDIR